MDNAQVTNHFDSLLKGFPDGEKYFYPNMDHNYILREYLFWGSNTIAHKFDDSYAMVIKAVSCQRPNPTPCGNMIQFYESKERANKEVITTIKPAKYIGKLMPWASDDYKAQFLAWFKDTFKPVEFTIIESKEESAFIEAYTGKPFGDKSPNHTDKHGFTIKSLTGSCMRKSFHALDKHPASVYASGDFSIVYAKENNTGHILARCIVGNDSAECIYTNDDLVTHAVEQYLVDKGVTNESKWAGLSLKKEYIGNGNYLMPYIDGYDYASDKGDSFEIGSGYGICLSNTNGQSSWEYEDEEDMGYCEDCEDSVSHGDLTTVINAMGDDICICIYCRNRDYSWSMIQHQYIPDESSITLYESDNRWGNVTQEYAIENGVYIESTDGWYNPSLCIYYEGEWYLKTDTNNIEVVNGEYLHKESDEYKEYKAAWETVESSGFEYVLTLDKGILGHQKSPSLAYVTKSKEVLRENYQLDSSDTPQRIDSFPDFESLCESVN